MPLSCVCVFISGSSTLHVSLVIIVIVQSWYSIHLNLALSLKIHTLKFSADTLNLSNIINAQSLVLYISLIFIVLVTFSSERRQKQPHLYQDDKDLLTTAQILD